MRSIILATALLVACDSSYSTVTGAVHQAVTACANCWTIDQLTVVYQVGAPAPNADTEIPTDEQLGRILTSPPAGSYDPTVADMLDVSSSVYNSLPTSVIEDMARPDGRRIGCVVDWNQWTCWLRVGGRTYYCSGTSAWISCSSFAGTWQ